jgi:hypothetical protein
MSRIKRQVAVEPQPTAHSQTQLSTTNSSSNTQAPPTTTPTVSTLTQKLSGIHYSLHGGSRVKRQIMMTMKVNFMKDIR